MGGADAVVRVCETAFTLCRFSHSAEKTPGDAPGGVRDVSADIVAEQLPIRQGANLLKETGEGLATVATGDGVPM